MNSQTKLTLEEWAETRFSTHGVDIIKFFDKHYEPTYLPDTYPISGTLTCKECGKVYKWNEWGKYMKNAFHWAQKHQVNKHNQPKPVFRYKDSDGSVKIYPLTKFLLGEETYAWFCRKTRTEE